MFTNLALCQKSCGLGFGQKNLTNVDQYFLIVLEHHIPPKKQNKLLSELAEDEMRKWELLLVVVNLILEDQMEGGLC